MAYILLAEDDPDCAALFSTWLHGAGHEVQHVTDGQAGLTAAAKQRKPDLVLTDLRMPEMNGSAFASLLHVLYPDCPVVAVTAFIHDNRVPLLQMEPNVCSVLPKPVDREHLLECIQRALEAPPTRIPTEE